MCGICGLLNYKGNARAAIAAMNLYMKDRGPDADGIWISPDEPVALGHRRLAIRDLSTNGSQPMKSHSGRYIMVYNGEIYNAGVLKDKLISDEVCKESDFRGTSDTEILLEYAENYGLYDALRMSKGMFAIGLYDVKTGRLQLARDRVGEKPLYYGFINHEVFGFASDIGCFTELPKFEKKINRSVLPLYFSHGYIPAPYSIYEDIYKLEPGTILTIDDPYGYFNPVDDGDLKEYYRSSKAGRSFNATNYYEGHTYKEVYDNIDELCQDTGHAYTIFWSMKEAALYGQNNIFKGTEAEASEELERLIKDSVKGQMIADVPLGAFLSAGIDSSTIVSLMQQVAPGRVRTFTIGMKEKGYNEAEIAKEIAGILGTEHTEMYIDDADAKRVIPDIPHMFGEPFADSSQIPTYLVSKMTREHVTVSLSGDAGDELFCGYTSYRSIERIWGKMGRIPYPVRRVASIITTPFAGFSDVAKIKAGLLGARNIADLHMIESDPWRYGRKITDIDKNPPDGRWNNRLLYAGNTLNNFLSETNRETMLMDMTMYHPDDILTKVDRTAMAVSLETRVPLLDRDIIEFAWTLPTSYLRDNKVGKKILRNVLYKYVPKELMDRPKKGFSIPIDQWLKEPELRAWAEGLIRRTKIKRQGYLNADAVHKIWDEFIKGGEWKPQIWYILMFQQWLEDNNL